MKVKYFPATAGIIALVLVAALVATILQSNSPEEEPSSTTTSETVKQVKPTSPPETNSSVKQTVSAPDAVESTVEVK